MKEKVMKKITIVSLFFIPSICLAQDAVFCHGGENINVCECRNLPVGTMSINASSPLVASFRDACATSSINGTRGVPFVGSSISGTDYAGRRTVLEFSSDGRLQQMNVSGNQQNLTARFDYTTGQPVASVFYFETGMSAPIQINTDTAPTTALQAGVLEEYSRIGIPLTVNQAPIEEESTPEKLSNPRSFEVIATRCGAPANDIAPSLFALNPQPWIGVPFGQSLGNL